MIGTAGYRLTRGAAVGRRDVVGSQESAAAAGSQWIRICIAIGLARRISRPGRVLLVNSEVRTIVNDVVVGDHVSRTKRGRDVIRTAGHCFAGCAAVGRCYGVVSSEAAATASRQRIRI